jgi:hypothetical protein
MGRNWIVAVEIVAPKRRAWLTSSADPSAFDWFAPLESSAKGAQRVSTLLTLLERETFARIAWEGDKLVLNALLAHEGSFWVERRTHLAAAIRSAGVRGAKGELAIVNAFDNAEDTALLVTSSGDARIVTGAERTTLRKRLAKIEAEIGRGG